MPADLRNHSGHALMAFPLDRPQPCALLVGQLGRPQPTDKSKEGPQNQEEGWPPMPGPPQPAPPNPPRITSSPLPPWHTSCCSSRVSDCPPPLEGLCVPI